MYVDLARPEPAVQRVRFTEAPLATADFTSVEWHVIGLARRDRVGSLGGRSRLGRWLRRAAGLTDANPLADARLEALRRVAVTLWTKRRMPAPHEIDMLLAAGFTLAQVALLASLCTNA